jgi:DNA-binding transcriptional regulator GbsR (MarR family)|tara:strand:+ start:280 stop:546 length:267 start_codon:yes stop_codon:yes gene_type:complete
MKKQYYKKLPTRLDNGENFAEYELIEEEIHKDVDTGKEVVIKRSNQYAANKDKAAIIKEYKDAIASIEEVNKKRVAELKAELTKHQDE